MVKKVKPNNQFHLSKSAEREFYQALKKVARTSSHIVESHVDGDKIINEKKMQLALKAYSDLIGPWAQKQSAKMLKGVASKNEKAYQSQSKAMGAALKLGVAKNDVEKAAIVLMNEQVTLIKSIPLEAGLRAQKIASESFFNGKRSNELAEELMKTGEVTESRAALIARTETARSNASINQARALSVGSQRYIWRNSGDEAVRDAHRVYKGKKLDGKIFDWDNPPTLDDGTTGHPGTFPNCRCYAEAVFDD